MTYSVDEMLDLCKKYEQEIIKLNSALVKSKNIASGAIDSIESGVVVNGLPVIKLTMLALVKIITEAEEALGA
jgi:hypothetical protein